MRIPKNLRAVSSAKKTKIIRAMQRGIKEECFACVGRSSKLVENCAGARLLKGEQCPLYEFRPRLEKKS